MGHSMGQSRVAKQRVLRMVWLGWREGRSAPWRVPPISKPSVARVSRGGSPTTTHTHTSWHFPHSARTHTHTHLLQVEDTADVTVGGVILPEAAKERPLLGTVVRTGPGRWDRDNKGERKAMVVKEGDKVLYFKKERAQGHGCQAGWQGAVLLEEQAAYA
eukprot:351032-Chlamydomonas_euryale.AAC.1